MAVHFVCACGKHLKARYRLRGWISFCPACGAHVKVPTGKATHSGVVADLRAPALPVSAPPLNARERSHAQAGSGALANRPAAQTAISRDRPLTGANSLIQNTTGKPPTRDNPPEILVRRQPRPDLTSHNRGPERRWFESIGYTLPACSLFAVDAAALALVSGAVLCALSGALPTNTSGGIRGPFFVPCVALLAVLLSFTIALLSGVLALARDASMRVVSTPSFDAVLRAIVQWLASFAAGPALLLAAAAAYLFLCGDPTVADGLILAELTVFAGGGFLVNLLVTSPDGGLRKLNPAAWLHAAGLLGWRVVAGSVVAAGALFAFGWVGGLVLEKLHVAVVEGFLWLGLWWFCALVLTAFLFRRLGLWYHHADASRRGPSSHPRDTKQRGSRLALARAPI